jgi:hypothetical protein
LYDGSYFENEEVEEEKSNWDDKISGYTWTRIYIDALENLDLRGCALGSGHLKLI